MQIFNTTLKTTVQARVTAATASTTLKDLMVLAKTARGLGINTTNIETLINTKLNALNGSSPLADLLVGALASGAIPDTVGALTTLNAVNAGDPMWVDVAGRVYGGNKYRMQLTAHNGTVMQGVRHDAYVKTDGFTASPSNVEAAGFAAVLSDGNLLVADGFSTAGNYGLRLRVLSADFGTVLNNDAGFINFIDNGSSFDYYAKLMAVYKMPTANVFRVFYRYVRNGETALSNIGYHDVTYTPATKVVAVAARVVAQSTGANQAFTSYGNPRHVTERYVIVKNEANNYHYVLDLQTNTLTEIVAARSLGLIFTDFIGSGTDWCAWARPILGTAAGFMVKTDGTTVAAPSALTTDGSMSGGQNRSVVQILKGVFLTHDNTNGALRVVVFNTTYTAANWATLAVDLIKAGTAGNIYVVKNGLRFYVYWSRVNFSFEVNNGNVSGFRWEDTKLKFVPPCFTSLSGLRLFDISETWLYLASLGATNSAVIFGGPLVEFMRQPASPVGVAMTDTAAGGICMVALDPKVQTAGVVTYDIHRPQFGGYTCQVDVPTEPLYETMSGQLAGASVVHGIVELTAVNTPLVQSVGSNGLLTLQGCHGIIYGSSPDTFAFQIASPFGKEQSSGSTSGAALAFKSEFPLYLYNQKTSASVVKIFK